DDETAGCRDGDGDGERARVEAEAGGGGEADREEQRGGGVVGEQLGEQVCQNVDNREGGERTGAGDDGLARFYNCGGEAGFFHRGGAAERCGDDEGRVPLDAAAGR